MNRGVVCVGGAGRTAAAGAEMIPLARKGDAEEIATVVRFLCGPASWTLAASP